MIDVFGPVVAMKIANVERKGHQSLFQHRHQEAFADAFDGEDTFELGDFVDGGNEVYPNAIKLNPMLLNLL